jgi:glycosyltransferase involved in cell wall biosynthesis
MKPSENRLKRPPRVLFLVENNPYPQDFRVRREAEELQRRGFDVMAIAPRKHGQAWHESVDGVDVLRFPAPPAGTGFIGYAIEFAYSTFAMLLLSLWRVVTRGVDVVHAANPPDTLVLIAILLRPFGVRFIFDHHDLSPEIYLARNGKNRAVMKTLNFLERLSLSWADAVISTNESYRTVALTRGGKKPEQVFVVRNGPPLSYVALPPDAYLVDRAPYLIGYVGTIGTQDGLDYLVRAGSHLVHALGRTDFLAVVVGDGDSLLHVKALVAELKLEKYFQFTGRLNEYDTRKTLSAATVCVQPDPYGLLNDQSTMNKLMEYMALGKPTVAFDLRETRFSAGDAALYAPPDDVGAFAAHIAALFDSPGERERLGALGRERIRTQLAWEHSVPALLACYARVLGESEIAQRLPDLPPPIRPEP